MNHLLLSNAISSAYSKVMVAAASTATGKLGGIAEWFNSWSDEVKALVPAIATFLAIIIGLIIMFAGRNWSEKAKMYAGAILVGILVIGYAPSIITSMLS